jgi:hypothetical protein
MEKDWNEEMQFESFTISTTLPGIFRGEISKGTAPCGFLL